MLYLNCLEWDELARVLCVSILFLNYPLEFGIPKCRNMKLLLYNYSIPFNVVLLQWSDWVLFFILLYSLTTLFYKCNTCFWRKFKNLHARVLFPSRSRKLKCIAIFSECNRWDAQTRLLCRLAENGNEICILYRKSGLLFLLYIRILWLFLVEK